MPMMTPPHLTGKVDVNEADVDRYRAAGWDRAESRSTQTTAAKKSTAKKSASASKK